MAGVKGTRSRYLIGWTGKVQWDSYQDVGFGGFLIVDSYGNGCEYKMPGLQREETREGYSFTLFMVRLHAFVPCDFILNI